jgi:hypothetical protein
MQNLQEDENTKNKREGLLDCNPAGDNILDSVYIDICRPIKLKTSKWYKVLVTCRFGKAIWTKRHEILPTTTAILLFLEEICDSTLKRCKNVATDRGSIYCSEKCPMGLKATETKIYWTVVYHPKSDRTA